MRNLPYSIFKVQEDCQNVACMTSIFSFKHVCVNKLVVRKIMLSHVRVGEMKCGLIREDETKSSGCNQPSRKLLKLHCWSQGESIKPQFHLQKAADDDNGFDAASSGCASQVK